jgi:hypothetical protein
MPRFAHRPASPHIKEAGAGCFVRSPGPRDSHVFLGNINEAEHYNPKEHRCISE